MGGSMEPFLHKREHDEDVAIHARATDDGLDGAPWWAKLGVKVGLPACGFAVLLWFFMQSMTADLRAIKSSADKAADAATAATAAATSTGATLSADHAAMLRLAERQQVLFQLICVNTARSDEARLNCVR